MHEDEVISRKDGDRTDICPHCHSYDIEGKPVVIDHSVASQECSCNNCGCAWVDYYEVYQTEIISLPQTTWRDLKGIVNAMEDYELDHVVGVTIEGVGGFWAVERVDTDEGLRIRRN